MDRWQLWRKVWSRLHHGRHRHSRRRYAIASRINSTPALHAHHAPPAGRYLLGRRHFSFVTSAQAIAQRPKVLTNVDCSSLLMGGSNQYENFSSTCWLEEHLHRFGDPHTPSMSFPSEPPHVSQTRNRDMHASSDAESGSGFGGFGENDEDFHDDSSAGEAEVDGPSTSNGRWRPLWFNIGSSSTVNLHRYTYQECDRPSTFIVEPPPYPNESPPSYEEAVAGKQVDLMWKSLLNLNENSDFLW